MRPLSMAGKCKTLLHGHEEAGASEWERRRAELEERRARLLADPVQGFYLRHGHRARHGMPPAAHSAEGSSGDDDPGLA
jgi:hypothetical protein